MDPEQSTTQILLQTQHSQWTKFHWQLTQQQKQQWNKQQQEHLHSDNIHTKTRGEVQKDMQQQGDTGTLEGNQYYKNPPHGPQGQG